MIPKILIASSDRGYTDICSTYLTNENKYRIEKTFTGSDTVKKYFEIQPDVLILNSCFNDINYIDIINELSACHDEKNKCNIILIINNLEEKLLLNNTAKIYQIFMKSEEKELGYLLDAIKFILSEFNISKLTEYELNSLLVELNFSLTAKGTKYIKSAINHCYYSLDTFCSLNEIFEIVADEYDTNIKTIRNCIRSSLIPLNTYKEFNASHSIVKLFNDYKSITPKYFIETVSTYLHVIKNKK